jgi:hypothetical protein
MALKSPIIMVIISRTMRWAEHGARMGDTRNLASISETNQLLGITRRRKGDNNKILQKYGVRAWTGLIWLRI